MTVRLWAAVAFAAITVGCESSPFEPRGEGERVPIGPVIQDSVVTDSIKWYSFSADSTELFVVFLEALQGRIFLSVQDSLHPSPNVPVLAAAVGGPRLDDNPSATFGTATHTVYRLGVGVFLPDSVGRYRFRIYLINQAPEHAPESFTFGDTVAGETIEPRVDVDRFIARGNLGEQIVAVAETPGPMGSGSVAVSVVDATTRAFLGYVIAVAGTATSLTTGRMRLPSSGDYEFTASSVSGNSYPRYHGPYRFWTYVVNPQPEHEAAAIPFDREIANERIDRAGDVDEFTFGATGGADYNVFVQGGARMFQVEVAPQGGAPIAIVTSQPEDTALFAHGTRRFHVTNGGTYVLRVTGTSPTLVADTGAYRLYLYAIDRQPERVGSTISPGETVSGEDIALPGDVDEFRFNGVAGEEYNAFLQAQNGSGDTRLQLEVVQPDGTLLRRVESAGSDTSLLHQPVGRFAIPTTGTYVLRISGLQSNNTQDRGPYRLFLYRIDRKPETASDILAFGDSVTSEAVDVPGDVDEYRVIVPDSSGAFLAFELASPPVGGNPTLQLLNSVNGQVLATVNGYGAQRASAGRMRIGPGQYIVRVDGNQDGGPSSFRGAYRLWFYRFGFGPEVAADTFAIGDTVSNESIDPWGDEDRFHFYGRRNQHLNVMVGLAPPSVDGAVSLIVSPPPGTVSGFAYIESGVTSGPLEDHQSNRIDLPATGWYTVQVDGMNNGFERGPFRFTVLPFDTRPEHVGLTLAAGDSVVSEPIDTPGDWDEFTLLGTPGQTMSVIFDGKDGFSGPYVYLRVFDPTTDDTLAWQPSQFRRIAGPFQIPAGGEVKISVSEPAGFIRSCYGPSCFGFFQFVGPYRFHVVSVNRAPENVAASFTVGDTVRGEAISPLGDIDEFTSSGTPGQQLTLVVRTWATVNADSALVLEVTDPATGTLIGSGTTRLAVDTFYAVGLFTVPAGGSFVVRARAYGDHGLGVGETGPYEFFIKP